MCGFGGIINSKKALTTAQAANISSRVGFRGPDSCGIRILDQQLAPTDQGMHALFFNRLAIIDIDNRSNQPFEDDRYLLIYNGEIYNYTELKEELVKQNISFHTSSDTEVLFEALKLWGNEAIGKLNGMFAFFWLDKRTRTFLACRDRLGIKPLYYYREGNTFAFASELYSVLRLTSLPLNLSHEAVDSYLWMQFVPSPLSIIKGVSKLPPGHYILGAIDCEDFSIVSFFDAYKVAQHRDRCTESKLEDILKNSLARQLHADVPLGLFLSSGVDSSLLAAMVNKYFTNGKEVNFFTVKFSEATQSDESDDAKTFIEGFHNPYLRAHTIQVDASLLRNRLEKLYHYFDEPFADPASLLNWAIAEKARQNVTVAISGDGADELFWGYSRYQRWEKFKTISSLPLAAPIARSLGRLMPSHAAANLHFVFETDPIRRHFNFFLPSGMRSRISDSITKYDLWALKDVRSIRNRPDLPAILDIKTYLADAMLYKVDRASMATSLEVRVPYLDNEVLNYALALPLRAKSNATYKSKAPLKSLLTRLAPHYPIERRKKGFSFPLQSWLKHQWKDRVLNTVTKHRLLEAGLDPASYLSLVNGFYTSKNNYFTDVWYLFNLCLWLENIKQELQE